MKRQSGNSRNLEPLREYDPYRPRAISVPQKAALVGAKRSTKTETKSKG